MQEARGARGERQEARDKKRAARGERQEARGKGQEARGKRQEVKGRVKKKAIRRTRRSRETAKGDLREDFTETRKHGKHTGVDPILGPGAK
jgi:hypothetical protein